MNWDDAITNFSEVEVYNDLGTTKVVWEYIGEGWYGDFDPTDATDEPLLRFAVCTRKGNGDWEYADDASYCTQNPVDLEHEHMVGIGKEIVRAFDACVNEGHSWKRSMEEASHWHPIEF